MGRISSISIATGIVSWLLASTVRSSAVYENSILQQIVPANHNELFIRLFVMGAIIVFGFYAQSMADKFTHVLSTHDTTHIATKQIFDTMNDGVRIIDNDHNVVQTNKAFLLMSDSEEDTILKMKCYETFSGPLCKSHECALRQIRGGRDHIDCHIVMTRSDNTAVPCRLTATPFRRPDGSLAGIFEEFRDITLEQEAEQKIRSSLEKWEKVATGTIQSMVQVVETMDPYTAGHQRRVADLACAIAREIGMSREHIDGLFMASSIHDIGKINIPTDILNKPNNLTKSEYQIIKTHPLVAYEILKKIDFPWPVAEIVYQHHERMNGSGYPQGIAGGNILLEARILAVADVVEALISDRPYRHALGIEMVLAEIVSFRGLLYDPVVVDTCFELFTKKHFEFEKQKTTPMLS